MQLQKFFETGLRKSCNEDASMGKAVSSDETFCKVHGNVTNEDDQQYDKADTESQRDFSDDIRVGYNFKINVSNSFCKETY